MANSKNSLFLLYFANFLLWIIQNVKFCIRIPKKAVLMSTSAPLVTMTVTKTQPAQTLMVLIPANVTRALKEMENLVRK